MAHLLHFRLRRLGLQVALLPSGGSELLEGLSQAEENDLVVLFSFSKLSREGRILLDHSRSAGYRTLAFVGRTCLPAEERADISLFAYRGTEKEYHSMAAPAALLDALAVAVAERLGDEGTQRLQSLHRMKRTISRTDERIPHGHAWGMRSFSRMMHRFTRILLRRGSGIKRL